jgi:hypothetical protein
MIIQPNLGYFQVFFYYMRRPLMQSVMKKKCLEGKTLVQSTAIATNWRHKLDVDSYTLSGDISQGCEHHFSTNWRKFFTLSIQLKTDNYFELDLVECAFNWLDLLIGSICIDFHLDRILLGTFGEAPVDVTCGIL